MKRYSLLSRASAMIAFLFFLLIANSELCYCQSNHESRNEFTNEQLNNMIGTYSIDELRILISSLETTLAIKVVAYYDGSKVYSDDDHLEYLGTITSPYGIDSIFNEYSVYGNEFSSECVWNEFSRYSSINEFNLNPPLIIKNRQVIGILTVNSYLPGAVNPYWLKAMFIK